MDNTMTARTEVSLQELIKHLKQEADVLEQTSKGHQAVMALRMLLTAAETGADVPNLRNGLIEQHFWATQVALQSATESDLELLLSHDPGLKFVRGFLTLQPMADQADLRLRLYEQGAILTKVNPETGKTLLRCSLEYTDDGLTAALVYIEAELRLRREAEQYIVGQHRPVGEQDTDAVKLYMQQLQSTTAQKVEDLKRGLAPKIAARSEVGSAVSVSRAQSEVAHQVE